MQTFRFPVSIQTVPIRVSNVEIYYPRVAGLADRIVQDRINNSIVRQVHALLNQQGYYQHPTTIEMRGYYEIKTNERGILSLTLSNYAYIPPSAHGLTVIKSLTFDLQTGKGYELKDLFKPGSDYVQRLSDIIRQQIPKRDFPLLGEFTSIRADQDYYIADKALVVYFQLYEITPYYVGLPMFPVSVYDVQDIVDENGPLGKMLPSE